MEFSVVIPVYNEEENVEPLIGPISTRLKKTKISRKMVKLLSKKKSLNARSSS
jgi:hypothetical protein